MLKRIEISTDKETAEKIKRQLGDNVSFGLGFELKTAVGGVSITIDPEKDPRILPNTAQAIMDTFDIFRNRITGVKVDGKNETMTEFLKRVQR